MSRIMAFDYGLKRTGIAVSDPLKLIATGLNTVDTKDLLPYIKDYFRDTDVDTFVFGNSLHKDGTPNKINNNIEGFAKVLYIMYPSIPQYFQREDSTSKQAMASLIQSGVPKQKRKNKALIDEVSATIILQNFMSEFQNKSKITEE